MMSKIEVAINQEKAIGSRSNHGKVREIRRHDILSVVTLIRDTIVCDPFINSLQKNYLLSYVDVGRIHILLSWGYFIVYTEDNDMPLGFAGIEDTRIRSMFVSPAKQRQGIGSLLLNHLEDYAFQNQSIQNGQMIFRAFSSEVAVPFYKHRGYVEQRRIVRNILGSSVYSVVMNKVVN